MELRDYLLVIGKRIWMLLICFLVVVIGVYFFTTSQPTSYEGSLTINITKPAEQGKTTEYQFDKYYALQASGMFAETVVSWLGDPSIISDIFTNANQELPQIGLTKLTKLLNPKKVLPSNVQVRYSSTDEGKIEPLLKSAGDFVKARSVNLTKQDVTNNFIVEVNDPVVFAKKISLTTNLIMGFIVGMILGLLMVFATEYLKSSKR
ncbi:MAG: hypothetical protein ACD_58C00304G0005 [uncultured bacterium]|nr:MAG: hypothetical protein ACD_58C00304G0005 [uncultured bacterium]